MAKHTQELAPGFLIYLVSVRKKGISASYLDSYEKAVLHRDGMAALAKRKGLEGFSHAAGGAGAGSPWRTRTAPESPFPS